MVESIEKEITHNQSQLDRKILETAIRIFNERGYYKTSVNEIADQLEIGKATIYRHFGNKFTLCIQAFHFIIKQIYDEIENRIYGKDFSDAIDLYFDIMISKNRQWGWFLSLSIHEQLSVITRHEISQSEMRNQLMLFKKNNQQFIDIVKRILEKGKKEGLISSEMDSQVYAELFHTSTLNYLRFVNVQSRIEYQTDDCFDMDKRFMALKDFLYRGIGFNN